MRSKRLRKKLFLDEFSCVGFEINGTKTGNTVEAEKTLDNLIDFIDSVGLETASWISVDGDLIKHSAVIMKSSRYGHTSEEDRQKVITYFCDNYDGVSISENIDLVYGDFENVNLKKIK